MKIDLEKVPFKALISVRSAFQRRKDAEKRCESLNWSVEWIVPIDISAIAWDELPLIYRKSPKYASQALTLIEVFTEVEKREIECFLLLEDDVVFHPEFLTKIERIKVPEDWKFFYIGGRNCGTRMDVSPGLVRSKFISDLHCVVIRSEMIPYLKRTLLNPRIFSHWPDARIATLHQEFPAYLCRPNLAWQSVHPNEEGISYSNYHNDGSVVVGKGN